MNSKEIYLSIEEIDREAVTIKNELSKPVIHSRDWDAALNLSALIVTDIQNYFLSPESHAFIPSAQAIIPNIQKLIEVFRNNDRPVIFTRHINNNDNAASMSYWWNDLIDEAETTSKLIEGLNSEQDIIITKHQYDAFYGTCLEDLLKSKSILYLLICGVMTNLCCETTVRSAFVRGFRPLLPLDATAAYNRDFHLATFRNLAFGFMPVMTTEEVIKRLQP